MNGSRSFLKRVGMAGLAVALCAALAAEAAQPYVILPNKKKVTGSSIRVDKDGNYLVTTATGVLTFSEVTKVVMDEPAPYTQAVQRMQQRQYGEAIAALEKVIIDYRMLEWDKKARRLLASAFLLNGNFAEAVNTFEAAFEEQTTMRDQDEPRLEYLRALEGAGAVEKLAAMLDETIAGSSRNVAAIAQLMRGNRRLAEGKTREALSDFMRTADFFREVKDVQPEALFRTGELLEKFDGEGAAAYYKRLVEEFPGSPFAAKARTKVKGSG